MKARAITYALCAFSIVPSFSVVRKSTEAWSYCGDSTENAGWNGSRLL